MFLEISRDGAGPRLSLEDENNFKAFHVTVPATWSQKEITENLESLGISFFPGSSTEVYVAKESVLELVGSRSKSWDESFEAMCSYAHSKGWTSPDGTQIKAHIQSA